MKCGSKHLSAAQLRELGLTVTLPVAGQEWVPHSIPCFNLNGRKLNDYSIVQFLRVSVCVILF